MFRATELAAVVLVCASAASAACTDRSDGDVSIRRILADRHAIDIQVNGVVLGSASFDVVEPY